MDKGKLKKVSNSYGHNKSSSGSPLALKHIKQLGKKPPFVPTQILKY